MIAAIVPFSALGNTIPVLTPALPRIPRQDASAQAWNSFRQDVQANLLDYIDFSPLLAANLNAFVYDYLARQKVHGQHLNFFIVEQLSVLPTEAYQRRFGQTAAAGIVRREVLHLTYVAGDMEPFAHDMDYEGPPFVWDEEDRRLGVAVLLVVKCRRERTRAC